MPDKLSQPEKAEQAVLLICDLMKECVGFGETVLSKVLYYSDKESFLDHGKTISGLNYVKQRWGPTPAPKQFQPLLAGMKSRGIVAEKTVVIKRAKQRRFVPLVSVENNLGRLSKEDIRILSEVAQKHSAHIAKTISDKSHNDMAWQIASHMEELPAFTHLLSESKPTAADKVWAKEQIENYKTASR